MFYCEYAAYFQESFLQEQLRVTAAKSLNIYATP